MGKEIERKFLVDPAQADAWRTAGASVRIRQGYLARTDRLVVRVRVAAELATLTIKGAQKGLTRDEFEFDIPESDAAALLERLCEGPLVEKTRYVIPAEVELSEQDGAAGAHAALVWEVDEFEGDNAGLIVAEIELPDESTAFKRPAWLRDEVTADPRYLNSNLATQPFSTWARASTASS